MTEHKPIETAFHFFDFIFDPYKGEETSLDSERILKESIQHINDIKIQKQQAILIDRNEGRKDAPKRNLFISSAAYSLSDKKYKCKISLLREDRLPDIVDRKDYSLTPIDLLTNQAIAETTNFYIDLSTGTPIVCCEYNHHGPRISDIEYYFRHVSNKILKISKKCEASIHMKLPVNEVLGSIAEVLKFDLKVRPNMLSYLYKDVADSFVTNMNALSNTIDPNFIRVEAFFREAGQKSKKNNKALNFVKRILKAVVNDENVIENFEDFNLVFENSDGAEQIFNLIKGKQEITVICKASRPGIPDSKELYTEAIKLFDEYILEKRSK